MLSLFSRVSATFRKAFGRKEVLADRQVLCAYAPESLLFPFCAYATWHDCLVFDLFAGLIERDQQGQFLGDLAESWAATPNRKIWRFTLRPEALWSNGEPLVAEDFVRSVKFLIEHKLLSQARYERLKHTFPLKHLQATIEGKLAADKLGVYAEDDRTVCFQLNHAMEESLLLAAVSDLTFFPIYRDYLDASQLSFLQQFDTKSIQGTTLITTGPFVISKQKIRNGAVLEKNPYYWNHRKVILDRIIYYFSLPYDLNRIDLFQCHFAYLREFPNWLVQFRENLHILAFYCPFHMFFNVKDPLLSSKTVRKALQQLLVSEKNDYFPYLSLEPFFSKKLLKVIQFEKKFNPLLAISAEERLKKARAFLEEAGFSEKNPLSLTISHTETYSRLTFKDMLVDRLKSIPFIKLSFKFLERNALEKSVLELRQFQLLADRWQMPLECPLFTLFTQAGNRAQQFTGFEHKRYTELCCQLLGDPSMDRQEESYRELFEILYDEVPYITLGYSVNALYHQSHIGGIKGGKAPRQSLVTLPKNKMLYCLEPTKLRSQRKQREFETMLSDVMRCPG